MSETIITICGKNLQAWKCSGAQGKRTVSLVASARIGDDVFSSEVSGRIEEFLRDLNGGKEEKPEPRSKLIELAARAKIPKLDELLQRINGSVRKRHTASLLISDIDLFIRKVELPFDDVRKARLAAPSVVATTLPFEGDVFVDVIPQSGEMGQGRFLAVCVRQEEIEHFERIFSNADFMLEQVVPGFLLLLPAIEKAENPSIEGIYIDGKIAAKAGRDWQESGSVRILPLAIIEEEFSGEERKQQTVIDMSGKNGGSGTPTEGWSKGIDDSMLGDYLNHPLLSGFNLISAKITELRDSSLKKTKKMLFTASAVLIALSLIFSIEGAKHFHRKKAESVKNVMGRKFVALMKGATMVDPVAQIKDRISSIEEDLSLFPSEATPFYSLLASISRSVKRDEGISIREINFVRGKLTITGEAPDQDAVTKLKSRLSGSGDRDVEITETGPAATEGLVKFKLTVT